jgi:hypothetical protein
MKEKVSIMDGSACALMIEHFCVRTMSHERGDANVFGCWYGSKANLKERKKIKICGSFKRNLRKSKNISQLFMKNSEILQRKRKYFEPTQKFAH